MADKLPFLASEGGTWKTTSPNPHVDLNGSVVAFGTQPVQTFFAAAADTELDFDSGHTCSVLVWVDASNWARYEGAVWTDASPDTLDLSAATRKGHAGTFSADATVSVVAELPTASSAPYLTGYTIQGYTGLTASSGTVTIPLDGRPYTYTLAANTTLALSGTPTAPVCADVQILVQQAASGGPYTLSYPGGWKWAGAVPTMPTAASSLLLLVVTALPSGMLVASGQAVA